MASETVKILYSGDCVGNPGRRVLAHCLPLLREKLGVDFVFANAENAAGGRGVTAEIVHELLALGVDIVTTGDHIWDNKGVLDIIDKSTRLLRPANLSPLSPGRGATLCEKNGVTVGLVQVLGRTFVPLPSNCPFEAVRREVDELGKSTRLIVVEIHAEATSEKIAMGRLLDGTASAVVGTHTHVQTADDRILPGGTAYLTDIGMTGPRDSVLGRDIESVLKRFVTGMYAPFSVAGGDGQLDAVLLELDRNTGRAVSIRRVQEIVPADLLKQSRDEGKQRFNGRAG